MAGPDEWRAVPGYEGLYEVSSLGQVRSLDDPARGRKGRVRKLYYDRGHWDVQLSKHSKVRIFRVDTLMRLAFA